ncbi:6-phospho-beta-glucosidase [Pseudocitrobacter vendiensis]|uniref:Family 4 glycosyl hydrolase, alpha-galactosidase/6-phospho-beta-glucosidase n=1 Tax=Pseudocitrobacter vendiensis TaxID=2488306 RepID=A0ABN8TAL2_9ENTR|nr:6-phospho-beta-glucosidase [Pseudocitrobacter vendiensis]CAH6659850.1 Family 4 glycosyl hydrolase, alpha-galactosidase/6-phospho-beta-glucosidase [Pseudocitrobacter vendiensis]
MQKLKVVTIGGGSSYTPELIDGFIKRYAELPVTDYYLLDIEEGKEKLEIVGKLAQRMVQQAGVPMNIHLTLDREEALKDADFVTTQLRVGFLEARITDERIPLKYGVLGQETTGPGGFMKAQRTIPVLLDICRDMEKWCPNAWLINFTNPAGIVTEAITRHSNIKTIGICSGANSMMMDIAKAYSVEKSAVDTRIIGLNHLIFADRIAIHGEDKTDDFINKLAEGSANNSLKNIPDIGFTARFAQALHMYPISYLKYFFLNREMVETAQQDAATKGTRGEQTREIEKRLFELYQDEHLNHKPKELEKRGGAWYSDTACSIISTIYNDKKEIHVVNTVNNGTTPDLPDHVTLETNAVIDKHGAHPVAYGRLPVKIRGLIQSVKAYEELTVEAAVTGDYDTALLALSINPLVPSATIAEQILDEYLDVNQRYLPQYAKDAK